MAAPRRREARSLLAVLDTLLFGFAGAAAAWLAYLLLREGLQPGWPMLLLVVFWLLVAYLVLPRLHRILTRLYLPGYFIGRARTSDGLLGDPVNVALLGAEAQVHAAMARAGWTRADDVSLASSMRIVGSTLSRRSYPEAPVSPLNLFDRQQDFAYQQEVAGSPSKRHHVRFWRCPDGWMLPGGYAVDWVAASTYDRSVGLSLMTFQVTHRIAADIDEERDYVVGSLVGDGQGAAVDIIHNFSTGYHSRNGGGDAIETDGDLPVIDLRSIDAPAPTPSAGPPTTRAKRPAPVVFGAVVACLRGFVYLLLAATALVDPAALADLPAEVRGDTASITATALVAVGVVDMALGAATFFGRDWARVLVMLSCVVTIGVAFVATVRGGPELTLGAGLPPVGLSILVLLALTSHRARDYATRDRHHPIG